MKRIATRVFAVLLCVSLQHSLIAAGIPIVARVDSLSDLPLPGEQVPILQTQPNYYTWLGIGATTTLLALIISGSRAEIIETIDQTEQSIKKIFRSIRAKLCPCRTRLTWCFCQTADGACSCIERGEPCRCITKEPREA